MIIPVVPAQGGAEVALDLIYRTCTHRAPARPVRACVPCANLLQGCCPRTSKNMTGARPHCNATPSEHFLHTSHCTLHTPHFILHTCTSHSKLHLISNNLISSRLMSPHLSSSHLIPSSTGQEALTNRDISLHNKKPCTRKACAHRSLRHTCIYTDKP